MGSNVIFWAGIPRYGNYGGPDYTGGQQFGTNFDVPPVDSLDAAFRRHDMAYLSTDLHARAAADFQLQLDIIQILKSPSFLSYEPRDQAYAIICYIVFPWLAVSKISETMHRDWSNFIHSSLKRITDPIILDIDGDGIELRALGERDAPSASSVYFDYDNDGFAERTGWVGPDDGMLALDLNNNGLIDNGGELFGTPNRDGFDLLETYDTFRDGIIDVKDTVFSDLKIWRDLDSDGITDPGELFTLDQAGVTSISLARTKLTGTSSGHDLGFRATFTRADGSIASAETIYFKTEREDTRSDNTPNFIRTDGVELLPQLPGSGTINSIAWKATQDAGFRAAWSALTDAVSTLSRAELLTRFEALLLDWAGVNQIDRSSRGMYVDARHLAFVEAYFGDTYQEVRGRVGQVITSNSPSSSASGVAIETNFDQIMEFLLVSFLAQSSSSSVLRGALPETIFNSPYFAYSILDFRSKSIADFPPLATPANLGTVIDLIRTFSPSEFGASVVWFEKGLSSLSAMIGPAFAGSAADYQAFILPLLADINDPVLRQIAIEFAKGSALHGRSGPDGLGGDTGNNVLVGGEGDDVLFGGAGNDIYVYAKADGSDWISDSGTSAADIDTLVLTDLNRLDVSLLRVGDTLIVKILSTGKKITIDGQFSTSSEGHDAGRGIETIRFADGSMIGRDVLLHEAVLDGSSLPGIFGAQFYGTPGDDVLRGGRGRDSFAVLGEGNDVILYGKGDGNDFISRPSVGSGRLTLQLIDLNPDDVEIYRDLANDLIIKIKSTGEFITDDFFFYGPTGALGVDEIKFAGGISWNRGEILAQVEMTGTSGRIPSLPLPSPIKSEVEKATTTSLA